MTPQERIEEAHGLWELAVQRVAAISEVVVLVTEVRPTDQVAVLLQRAHVDERAAFAHWQAVSAEALKVGP